MRRFGFFHSLAPFLIVLLAWIAYCLAVVGAARGPMHGGSDLGGWEALGFYTWENLDFSWFIPRILFSNNIHFYPEGLSAVFHSWAIERDLFYGTLQRIFGIGPWLGLYLCLSYLLTAFGTFFLLRNRIQPYFAALISIAATFINAYGVNKFPLHYGIGIYHWSLLSVLVDHLILRDLIKKQELNGKLLLLRVFLTIACLGHELGYIAGLGLTSLIAHGSTAVLWMLIRRSPGRLRWPEPKYLWIMGFAIASVAYWYLGPFFSIFAEVKRMQSPEIMAGGWWAHPARFFAPLFSPWYADIAGGWGDTPDGFAPNSPGWTLLSLTAGGLVFAIVRREWSILPLVLMLTLFVQYHPGQSTILGSLPWFQYARMGPRLTVVYPMLLCCIALCMHVGTKPKSWGTVVKVLAYGSALIWSTLEIPFIYREKIGQQAFQPLPSAFVEHMEQVKRAPAEAVFDWPFCYTGGNGGGVCPNYGTLEAVWANRKYHHKKVVGTYFSRLRAQDYDFYTKYGLDSLLQAQHVRCLTEAELIYLKAFYDYYSFAGMHLYTAVLPPACLPMYVTVFGPATRTLDFPGLGTVWYWAHTPDELSRAESGLTNSQFYAYRFQLVTRLMERKGPAIERIWLPRDQKPIYSFLFERFAKSFEARIVWYDDLPPIDSDRLSPADIVVRDSQNRIDFAQGSASDTPL